PRPRPAAHGLAPSWAGPKAVSGQHLWLGLAWPKWAWPGSAHGLRPGHAHHYPRHPPPIINEQGEEEFFIDKIIDERVRGRGKQYLVRWKGQSPAYDLWRPGRDLADTEALDVWERRAIV
ncbi:hypothetical protein H0H92_015734, partial [Tricholoma furcatifolium]